MLNLQENAAVEIAKKLVADADVFVQNFRPGVIERIGLGEAALREINPNLIYVSITSFGTEGPDAHRPVYDHIIQGMSGAASMQGDPLSGKPEYIKNAVCDKVTAYTAAQAITAALLARERGAGGQHLRVAMLDAALSFLWTDGMTNQTILEDDVPMAPPISASYRFIETSDGYLSVAAITDRQWHGIYRAVDRPELVDDPRFATAEGRTQNFLALLEVLGGGKVDMTTAEALERLQAQDVPCGPILSPEEIPGHPQVVASKSLEIAEHPELGRIRQPLPPAEFERTPAAISRPSPGLGEHTDEVLAGIGLTRDEIADARAKGVAS